MDGQAKKDLKRIGRGHHHGTVSMSEPAGLGNRCERYQKLAVLGHIFSVIVPSTYPLTDQCGGIIMALFGKACTRKPYPCSAYEIERASGAWRSKKTTTKNTGQGRGGQGRLAMGPAGISSGAGLDNGQLFPGPHVFFAWSPGLPGSSFQIPTARPVKVNGKSEAAAHKVQNLEQKQNGYATGEAGTSIMCLARRCLLSRHWKHYEITIKY